MAKTIGIESVKDTALYQELVKRGDKSLTAFVANIPELCEEATDRAKIIPRFFHEYTLHDKTHFIRVAELMARIVGDTIHYLNNIEIGLLILSAFFHDQGMMIDSDEYLQLEKDEDFIVFKQNWYLAHPNFAEISRQLSDHNIKEGEKLRLSKKIAELDSAMLTDYLRGTHGERAKKYIVEKYTSDKRLSAYDITLAEYLAEISLSHTKSMEWIHGNRHLQLEELIGEASVNMRYIAYVLRLADILDFDSDRTPDVLFNSIHFTSQISVLEWQKHRSVRGWKITTDKIQFNMSFEHPVYEKTARTFLDWIDEELESVHADIRSFPADCAGYKIGIAHKVDRSCLKAKNNAYLFHDLEFSLSRNEIVKLLMTDQLYSNTSLFIRELLQNSLDAIRLRKAIHKKDGLDWNDGAVVFRHYLDENNEEVVECSDNGCGMDERIISGFLGKVGRSYYRSPEFEQLRIKLKEKNVDFEPCSQFGIGFMSLFMVGDRIQIKTRKDYGAGKDHGKPLIIEINGLGGLMVIKEGDKNQEIGTNIKVFCREKPLFYDEKRDKIKLIRTLEGYALATEFPISGSCEIEGIKKKCEIPDTIDKRKTFLEGLGLKNIRTFEVDLHDINENLYGYMRQSFLVNKKGIPSLSNNEAEWGVDDAHIDLHCEKFFLLKERKLKLKDNDLNFRGKYSICLDGILVEGYLGRDNQDYYREEVGGWNDYGKHPLLVDIRGEIKPEITPAREPVHYEPIFKWEKIAYYISKANGKICEMILKLSASGLSPSLFWQLLQIYGIQNSLFNVKIDSVLTYLSLPLKEDKWIKLSDIKSFVIEDNGRVIVEDFEGIRYYSIIPDNINKWIRPYSEASERNRKYLMTILYLTSELIFSLKKELIFCSNKSLDREKLLSDYYLSGIYTIPFNGLDTSYIMTIQNESFFNYRNPLIQLAMKLEYIEQKTEIEYFVWSLIEVFGDRLFEDKKGNVKKEIDVKKIKYISVLYASIGWDKYSDDLKPPYKIYFDKDTTIEITDSLLREWAKQ